jgi:hypothetical protein
MLRKSGTKPLESRKPLLSEEEIRKLLGEDGKKEQIPEAKTFKNIEEQIPEAKTFKNIEEQIPDKNKILDKYKESKKERNLIKIISHRKLLEKHNYAQNIL